MRWFKHMTNSRMDEKLARFTDRYGLEAYGFFWRVLEIIAESMDETDRNHAEYSAKSWCNLLGIRPQTFRKLIRESAFLGLFEVGFNGVFARFENGFCEVFDLFEKRFSDVMITIKSPNILKYRDEYTERRARKSGRCRDSVGTLARAFKDTDIDIEEEDITPPSPPQGDDGCSVVDDSLSLSKKPKPKRERKTTGNSVPELQAVIEAYTPDTGLREALNAYRVMRERIRKPLTGDGLRYTFRELDKLCGDDDTQKIAVVEQSVQRSWQGLFPVRDSSAPNASACGEEDPTNGHGPIFFPDGTSNPWGTFWQSMLEDGHSTPEEVAKKGYNLDEARKIWESGKRNKAGVRHATADGRANPDLVGALQGRPGGATSGLGTAAAS